MNTFAPSYESSHLKNTQEEIAFLRERLAKKEKEMVALAENKNELTQEHKEQIIRQTINEYKQAPSHQVLNPDFAIPEERSEAIVLELSPEEHDDKVSELLGMMQSHGIKNVLNVIEKMNDPHIQDDFERFLVQYLKAGFPIQGMNEKAPEFKALHMTLFEVTLPEKTEEEKEHSLKEVISKMEQFYSGMFSVDDKYGAGYSTI